MTVLNYTINKINPEKLCDEILAAVGKKLRVSADGEVEDGHFDYLQPNLELSFNDTLTAGEITSVNNVVANHTP